MAQIIVVAFRKPSFVERTAVILHITTQSVFNLAGHFAGISKEEISHDLADFIKRRVVPVYVVAYCRHILYT